MTEPDYSPQARTWYRPMRGRSHEELHRASTPLELLFDLCFVVAVALASRSLHHAFVEHHLGQGVLHYAMVFFAIWWAWMNFTWFASAYDTDDVPYRITTFAQMAGVLVLAAGVPRAFDNQDFGIVTFGYVIMRLAMVTQWLRVHRSDPIRSATALRFAVGLTLLQAGWIVLLFLPEDMKLLGFGLLVLGELAVPVVAERASATAWHPEHIAERYGLFTLIVLGESVLAATTAIQSSLDSGQNEAKLLTLAVAGLVIVFSMWWIYFDQPAAHLLRTQPRAFIWGYGHLLIFASAAAVGVGLAVGVDFKMHQTHLSATEAGFVIATPVALFVLSVWLLHLTLDQFALNVAFPSAGLMILLSPFSGVAVYLTALAMVLLSGTTFLLRRGAVGINAQT